MPSHGAVVAREYGIPYVASLRGACSTTRSDDLVELDGAAGTLRIVQRKRVKKM
jgi:pyruvate,water dikinase